MRAALALLHALCIQMIDLILGELCVPDFDIVDDHIGGLGPAVVLGSYDEGLDL